MLAILRRGKFLFYGNEKRVIKRLLKNQRGDKILEWESRHSMGAVTLDVWQEWHDGVDPNVKRANALCVCEPKPRNRQSRLPTRR